MVKVDELALLRRDRVPTMWAQSAERRQNLGEINLLFLWHLGLLGQRLDWTLAAIWPVPSSFIYTDR